MPGLDGLGQPHLVVLGEEGILPDVGEVETDKIFLVALDALLGQGMLLDKAVEPGRGQPGSTSWDGYYDNDEVNPFHLPGRTERDLRARGVHRLRGRRVTQRGRRPCPMTTPDTTSGDVELTIVTLRFDAADPDRLLGVLAKYVVLDPGSRRLPQRRPLRVGDHARAVPRHREVGVARRPSEPTSTPPTWWRWPSRAAGCWPARPRSTSSRASAPTTCGDGAEQHHRERRRHADDQVEPEGGVEACPVGDRHRPGRERPAQAG